MCLRLLGVYAQEPETITRDVKLSNGVSFNASESSNFTTTTSRDGSIIPSDCFPAIFGFGDSQMDTGNAVSAFPSRFSSPQSYPYGMSYFSSSSPDRYCDGRLFIDFAAQAAGLPLLHPYLKGFGANFASGANFAVVGATALNTTFITPFHLGTQVDWFRKFKSSVDQALASEEDTHGVFLLFQKHALDREAILFKEVIKLPFLHGVIVSLGVFGVVERHLEDRGHIRLAEGGAIREVGALLLRQCWW
ncbi:hypothetical protein L7F22_012667 [Adiantum nelumboides]|nr:hypothetical protein [Adiantum nelumboides]